jgi:hypothetical protein
MPAPSGRFNACALRRRDVRADLIADNAVPNKNIGHSAEAALFAATTARRRLQVVFAQ